MKLDVALTLLLGFLGQAQQIGSAINKAREEGRDDLTDDEVDSFARADDGAKDRLEEWLQSKGV